MGAFDPMARRRIAYWARRVLSWLGKDRPRRLRRRGRPIDPEFTATELLYLRCRKVSIRSGQLPDLAVIRFPDQSVNRSKYSKPSDVLIPDPGNASAKNWIYWGILAFEVGAVPSEVKDGQFGACKVKVEHDPLGHNYAHTEIRMYLHGRRVTEKEKKLVGREDRKLFRLAILDRAFIICQPLM
jgi:hypothetical protein